MIHYLGNFHIDLFTVTTGAISDAKEPYLLLQENTIVSFATKATKLIYRYSCNYSSLENSREFDSNFVNFTNKIGVNVVNC